MPRRRGLLALAVTVIGLATVAGIVALLLAREFDRSIGEKVALVRGHPAKGVQRTDLPPLLAGYVARSRIRGPEHIRSMRIEQRGEMRMAADGPWLPLTAVQHSAAADLAFVWRADVRMAPLMHAVVIDGLVARQGILEARL